MRLPLAFFLLLPSQIFLRAFYLFLAFFAVCAVLEIFILCETRFIVIQHRRRLICKLVFLLDQRRLTYKASLKITPAQAFFAGIAVGAVFISAAAKPAVFRKLRNVFRRKHRFVPYKLLLTFSNALCYLVELGKGDALAAKRYLAL